MQLDFYFDVVCPYAYMASTRVEALAARTGAALRWRPILLGGVFRHHDAPQVPAATMSPPRARLNHLDILREAERLDLPLAFPPEHPRRTVDAMRLVVGAPEDRRVPVAKALFHAYWVEGRDVADRAVLAAIAREQGVDPGVIAEARQALFDRTAEAAARGVFGVPTLAVGDALFWGADRLHFVEEALGGDPRRAEPAPVAKGQPHLVFFHDFSSPFSYLASTQVERVAARHGARLEKVPILLGGLFREIGTPIVPLLVMNAAKQAGLREDMARWARWWGVPFRQPTTFPLRTVTPLRVAIVAPETTDAIYRAAWADDRDVGDEAVLREVLDRAGFDGAGLIAATRAAEVKARLRANTDRARESGACGVPTFLVDGEVLVWGQDRIHVVEEALAGWRPRCG